MVHHLRLIRRALVLLAVLGATGPTPASAAGGPEVTIDAANVTRAGINPAVGGVVMQVVSQSTPDALLLGHGATTGRYQTLFHSHPAANMPVCWSGTEEDFAQLDAQISKGIAAGLDPSGIHLQLLYISPCDIVPGPADDAALLASPSGDGAEPARAQLPSASGVAILTNPSAVKAMVQQQMRHVATEFGVTAFTVWNEPEGLYPLAPQAYVRYYGLVHEAMTELERELGVDLQIGGPVVASAIGLRTYLPPLLDAVVANRWTIDRVVFHRYGETDSKPTTTVSDITREQIAVARAAVADRQAAAAAAGVVLDPVISINEWGWSATASSDVARTGAGAAFAISQLATFVDTGIGAADYFAVQDNKAPPKRCSEPCEASGTDMIGFGLLDRNDAKRPAYHAFEFFNRLGPDRVAATYEGPQLGDKQEWGALAGRDAAGVVRVLLWNFDPNSEGATVTPQLALTGLDAASVQIEQTTADMVAGDEPTTAVVDPGELALTLGPNTATLLTFSPPG